MSANAAAQYSVTLKVRLDNQPGVLGRLATEIGAVGGNIFAIDGFVAKGPTLERDIVVKCASEAHQEQVVAVAAAVDGVTVLESFDRTFRMHEGGKIEVLPLHPVGDQDDLSMAYTPGVARVCLAIAADESKADSHTIRKNTVAIVSDGTAVLGLGDIGPKAAMPVMEGKALLFKEFGQVDAFPICLEADSAEDIVETVVRLAPTFGGINLEDIAAPRCFHVEDELKKRLDIPVFHDDQHGTAVVALAGLWNALKLVGKRLEDATVVVAGAGAAGVAITRILRLTGVGDIIVTDRKGAIHGDRDDLNPAKQWLADNTNASARAGTLGEVLAGADVFLGVSGPDLVTPDEVRAMAADPIVFAMANPDPEIRPEQCDGLVAVMATGRSDYPNQINNVLAFPGIFRGALDARASDVTEGMKLAAATAIAESIPADELRPDFIVPSVFDKSVPMRVAVAVEKAAISDGVARR